ncbi:transcriptional regulator [Paenibacillus baekrokdamisoli]|uniref:Transcriptional regulator n=1 Tax=Paenibacillus baekrokdamisoli TaxID=1712516 RepID=A0A3G9J3H6_9BACL|nr:metalloregulator ArsR/SmtB family transcription factor [Paenibacillus baekrokdamisoli]MBB3072059.1 ArsR family transcriptional regulator [Paenibacillus baekrokdamisoli]BBH20361.1 transcriptional regulator [Paenibacillus baekrokdamisoli]
MIPLDALAETLKLLSDKTRLTILALLKEKEMCVCDIVEILQMTQPNVSQHLRKLKIGGLVNETRRSQWIYYSLNVHDKPYLQGILDQLPSMREQIDAVKAESCN